MVSRTYLERKLSIGLILNIRVHKKENDTEKTNVGIIAPLSLKTENGKFSTNTSAGNQVTAAIRTRKKTYGHPDKLESDLFL